MTIIDRAGLFDISEATYHADPVKVPSLSSSIGKKLINQSPRHAFDAHPRLNPDHQVENRTIYDLGSAAHKIMLGKGAELVVIDAADYKTKAAKEARDDAYAAGNTPLLPHQYENALAMVKVGRQQLDAHEDASVAFTDGKPEVMMVWQEGDVWCRALLDWLPNTGRVFHDYKTTAMSANPETYGRTLFNLGFDFQSAFYRRGIRAVMGIADPIFEFVVQENTAPHALSVVGLPPAALDEAEIDVQRAIDLWNTCLSNDCWPGYSRRTYYVDPPGYLMAQRLDREARDSLQTVEPGKEMLGTMMDWQRPLAKGDAA
ncbi:hypothetical protein HBA54_19255 [Pelagibius litoralis]|uniref:Putative exodeoxyribonuclease 8 PDDEXK-like domain-containing protein n=1 Tax=Pelagibius litoralis TaxID=374515 RepID=A0A967KGZ3_9PROT|nr:PD-(D/E)XK nuclease-like domain-containing protein [Pelagibius litoralis]NIA70741.1 hypothetical protein [Pelagibius litoralis]